MSSVIHTKVIDKPYDEIKEQTLTQVVSPTLSL